MTLAGLYLEHSRLGTCPWFRSLLGSPKWQDVLQMQSFSKTKKAISYNNSTWQSGWTASSAHSLGEPTKVFTRSKLPLEPIQYHFIHYNLQVDMGPYLPSSLFGRIELTQDRLMSYRKQVHLNVLKTLKKIEVSELTDSVALVLTRGKLSARRHYWLAPISRGWILPPAFTGCTRVMMCALCGWTIGWPVLHTPFQQVLWSKTLAPDDFSQE